MCGGVAWYMGPFGRVQWDKRHSMRCVVCMST
jgi:hypothetical protein